MKIGIFGGTFDILHDAHKAIIETMLNRVNILYIIPTSITYYRNSTSMHTFGERLFCLQRAMILEAMQNPRYNNIIVSDLEQDKPSSWSFADTLKAIKKRYPGSEIEVAIGSDSFLNIKTWRNWEDIVANCKLVVFTRPGYEIDTASTEFANINYSLVPLNINLSATMIREKARGMNDEEYAKMRDSDYWKNRWS